MTRSLDQRLLDAHQDEDRAALVALYEKAADCAEAVEARSFYLTHAYVFALEVGHSHATALHARLKRLGREE